MGAGWQQRGLASVLENVQVDLILVVSLQSLFDSPRIQSESGSGCQVVACFGCHVAAQTFSMQDSRA